MHELVNRWRERAGNLRNWGATETARSFACAADELEAALAERDDELLTLVQAAQVCGYTADHLGRLVRAGTLPNRGRPKAPRLRRGDLPHRPGTVTRPDDMEAVVRRAIAGVIG